MSIKTATLNGVATIEIARPEKKNALTLAMYRAMADAITAATTDPQVRALLITGQPGIFTSGNDIEDFMQRPADGMESPAFLFMKALLACDKPVIAAVTGAAIGVGTTMLLHCDFVYVSDEARLAMPFTSLGLVPEFASSLVVPQLMGNVRAAEKILLGDPFSGTEAVECGIANAVLPAAEVVPHARRIAERFNALPPGAVQESKRLLRRARAQAALETLAVEGEVFARRLRSPEAQEAFSAFFQKRKPDFSKF
jgi:enoyl-CoA hydratase/carnithine racemase